MNKKRATFHGMIAVIAACIVGIAVVAFFVLKYAPGNESFSELYFENHEQLPDKTRVGEEENFAFTVVSYESDRTSYDCAVNFDGKVIKEETFTLLPHNKRTVGVKFAAGESSLVVADSTTHVRKTNFEVGSIVGIAWVEEKTMESFPWALTQRLKPEDGTFMLPTKFRYDTATELHVLLKMDQNSKDSFLFSYVDKQDLKSNGKKIGYIIREEKQTIINEYGKIALIQENTDTEYRYGKKKISVEVSANGKEYEVHFWTTVEELAELKE